MMQNFECSQRPRSRSAGTAQASPFLWPERKKVGDWSHPLRRAALLDCCPEPTPVGGRWTRVIVTGTDGKAILPVS